MWQHGRKFPVYLWHSFVQRNADWLWWDSSHRTLEVFVRCKADLKNCLMLVHCAVCHMVFFNVDFAFLFSLCKIAIALAIRQFKTRPIARFLGLLNGLCFTTVVSIMRSTKLLVGLSTWRTRLKGMVNPLHCVPWQKNLLKHSNLYGKWCCCWLGTYTIYFSDTIHVSKLERFNSGRLHHFHVKFKLQRHQQTHSCGEAHKEYYFLHVCKRKCLTHWIQAKITVYFAFVC